MSESIFQKKISYACEKKENLIDESIFKYAYRSIFAGAALTLSTWGGMIAADNAMMIHPSLGKFLFAFIFSWGLIYILFMNGELATSNMMYLTAGVYLKKIKAKKAIYILLICTIFNLLGALIISLFATYSGNLELLKETSFVVQTVSNKIAHSNFEIFFGAIAANILVNIAILSFILAKEDSAKILIVISAIFIFVYLGLDHVIANFASFSLVLTSHAKEFIFNFNLLNILRQWTFAYLGNYVGGGILIGFAYAWLNNSKTNYLD